jgi:hypothetical protein
VREQQSPPEYAIQAKVAMPDAAVRAFDEPTQYSSWPVIEPSDSNFGHGRKLTDGAAGNAEVMRGWDNAGREESGIDRIMLAEVEPTWAPELRGHRRVDVLDDGQGFRVWFVAGALIVAFSLGWVGGAYSDRLLSFGSDAGKAQWPSASTGLVGSEAQTVLAKGDRFASSASEGNSAVPNVRKVSTVASNAPEHRPSAGDARLAAASPASPSPVTRERVPGTAARSEAQNLARLTPAPETRPATIAGWAVREVNGGTAVLEGPGGVWKATTGETVPGVGRVHSIVRWGGHWIVATSRGLIATR